MPNPSRLIPPASLPLARPSATPPLACLPHPRGKQACPKAYPPYKANSRLLKLKKFFLKKVFFLFF